MNLKYKGTVGEKILFLGNMLIELTLPFWEIFSVFTIIRVIPCKKSILNVSVRYFSNEGSNEVAG